MKKPAIDHFERVVREELNMCTSAEDMLIVLARNYDLRKKIGPITRLAFMQGLYQAVVLLNPDINETRKRAPCTELKPGSALRRVPWVW
jgi:hypothetical protein